MEEKEKTVCLADSSGSDGSLSKDLPKRAELNFSTASLPLEIDVDENNCKDEKEDMTSLQSGRGTMAPEQKEKVLSPDYCSMDKMSDNEVDALMVCEKCHGPITKLKRYGNSSKQFCSRHCAQSEQIDKLSVANDGVEGAIVSGEEFAINSKDAVVSSTKTLQAIESLIPEKYDGEGRKIEENEKDAKIFDWKEYQEELYKKAASSSCFSKLSKPVKGLKPGMKLEAIDKNNPCNYCVATVIEVVGHRVRIRYDGFGDDSSQDFWCNFQAEELFQIGWCAENSFPLQPPTGITSTLEDWKIFLTKTLTGALASPLDLFRENENRIQTKVHSYTAGMKVEVIHPKRPSIICLARITKSLGPFHYQVTTEPLPNLPSHVFYGKSESTGIFSIGWCARHGIDLALPAYFDERNLTKEKYLAMCRLKSAPVAISEGKRIKSNFKTGQKLEAVDLEEPFMVRVATIFNVIGRVLLLLFDGHNKFQYVDYESEDIYPIGWCMKTGHPLSTQHGIIYPSKVENLTEAEVMVDDSGVRSVTLPSFHTVLGKQGPQIKEELNKKLKAKVDTAVATASYDSPIPVTIKDPQEKGPEDGEKQDNYSVHFNKACIIGPYLDPERLANISEKTTSARPPAAVKLALEKIIEIAIDPIETMDVIQDGFGAKLFSKGKSKVLKKGLFRFDTKVRASRLLKRLCKRLKSCEYFLSFDLPKEPCPFDCQNSGTTTLENFIAMKNSHLSNDEPSQKLLDYRKRRGRPRKDSDIHFETKAIYGKSEGESTKPNSVKVLNLTSYNGRPLIPIAPGSKPPVTIMSSSQLPQARMPPPYEMGSQSSFIQQGNTVITSATQARMVTPMNVRMIPPNSKAAVVAAGGDLASPTFSTPNLATVLVVTKPQPGQGLYSIRGNSQGIRLPMSPGSRKNHLQLINNPRSKFSGPIRIHGPMFDQAPGTMNPIGSGGEAKQGRNEGSQKFAKLGQQLHIPTQKMGHSQMFDGDHEMISEPSLYRSHVDKMSAGQIGRFVGMKQPLDIKLEPQDQFYQGPETSQEQRLSPSPHVHLPSSNYRHIGSINNMQDKNSPVDGIRTDTIRLENMRPDGMRQDGMRQDGMRPDGMRTDGITLLVSDHDAEKSNRILTSVASPSSNELGLKYDMGGHQTMKRHIPNSLQNHYKNHLKVATTNAGDSQSALSPLHSPPPLRPAPASQHRSIALRSPPNLTPSTVISHFDFSPVITTTSVISQSGRLIHHPGPAINSKCYMEDNHNMGNGKIRSHDIGTATCVGNSMDNTSSLNQQAAQPKTATMNFTYIPIKDQATDKIVYVPVNREAAEKDRQQPLFIYSKQHKHSHRFREQLPGSTPQMVGQTELKPVLAPLDDARLQPFSGVTRKFTVRTLHRDSNVGSLASGATTVRIQGPNFKEVKSSSDNSQDNEVYSTKDGFSDGRTRSSPNVVTPTSDVIPVQQKIGDDLLNQRNGIPSTQTGRLDGDTSLFESSDLMYEEVSDDDDDDEMDFVFSDDDTENDGSSVDRRRGQGFQGNHQGKKHLLPRRKSTSNHQHKLKYRQALEQAKFMREQRPTFFTPQMQARHANEFNSVSRENLSAFQFERNGPSRPEENIETREEKVKDRLFGSNPNIESIGNSQGNVNGSEMQTTVVNKGLLVAKDPKSNSNNPSQVEFIDRGGSEMKNMKRRKIEQSSKYGNGFVFGQWTLGEDIQIKKRKILNGTQSNSTRYLSDPLEKVKLPEDPELWSEEDVANFINATDCSEFADTLKDQEIDGSALLLLTRESLMEFAGMKLGPALKICGYIATLKGRLRMQQNMALIQG